MGFEPMSSANTSAVLYQLSYQANWELVTLGVRNDWGGGWGLVGIRSGWVLCMYVYDGGGGGISDVSFWVENLHAWYFGGLRDRSRIFFRS